MISGAAGCSRTRDDRAAVSAEEDTTVKYALAALCLLLVGVVSAGCGDGNASSPFAGNWAGTWSRPGTGATGTLSGSIGSSGSFTGSVHDNSTGQNGTFTGSLANNGSVSLTESYPNQIVTGKGTLAINSGGHLAGTIQEFVGGNLV